MSFPGPNQPPSNGGGNGTNGGVDKSPINSPILPILP